MSRPLIGLTGRRRLGAQVAGFVASMETAEIDVFVRHYASAIVEAGGLPVLLPGHIDPDEYRGRLDGLVLTGGSDVDPARYGADPHPALGVLEPERDAFEMGLVDAAVATDVPILGICRGMQLLNVWAGGSLHQHVPDHAQWDIETDRIVDEVTIVPGTELAGLLGPRRLGVNSLHHQTVAGVADGWVVSARSTDGTVEALEWPGHDVLAVQWHPEMLGTRAGDPLFRWIVGRAASRHATTVPR